MGPDTCVVLGFLCLTLPRLLHEPASSRQLTTVKDLAFFFSSSFSKLLWVQKLVEFSVSHSVTLETQWSLLPQVLESCVSVIWRRVSPGGLQWETTCRHPVRAFACFPATGRGKMFPGHRLCVLILFPPPRLTGH